MAEPCGMKRMKLGSQGLDLSAQGLGCMGLSAPPSKPETDAIALIHHAINSGVTFLDTSDMYGPHTNELLLGKALKNGMKEKVELATKFGIIFAEGKMEVKGDPAYVRAACEASLKRLDVDCIDLYYQHRIDTRVPIEITVWSRVGDIGAFWRFLECLAERLSSLSRNQDCIDRHTFGVDRHTSEMGRFGGLMKNEDFALWPRSFQYLQRSPSRD